LLVSPRDATKGLFLLCRVGRKTGGEKKRRSYVGSPELISDCPGFWRKGFFAGMIEKHRLYLSGIQSQEAGTGVFTSEITTMPLSAGSSARAARGPGLSPRTKTSVFSICSQGRPEGTRILSLLRTGPGARGFNEKNRQFRVRRREKPFRPVGKFLVI